MTIPERLENCRNLIHELRHDSSVVVSALEKTVAAVREGVSFPEEFGKVEDFRKKYDHLMSSVRGIAAEAGGLADTTPASLDDTEERLRLIEARLSSFEWHHFLLEVLDWAAGITFTSTSKTAPGEADRFRQRAEKLRGILSADASSETVFRDDGLPVFLRLFRLHHDRSALTGFLPEIHASLSELPTIALAFIVGEPSYTPPSGVGPPAPDEETWCKIEEYVREKGDRSPGVDKPPDESIASHAAATPKTTLPKDTPMDSRLLPRDRDVPVMDRITRQMLTKSLGPLASGSMPVSAAPTSPSLKKTREERPEPVPEAEIAPHPAEIDPPAETRLPETDGPSSHDTVVPPHGKQPPMSLVAFPPDLENLQSAANEYLQAPPEEDRDRIQQIIWLLLGEHRIGPAYYLSLYLEEKYAESDIPKELFETMAIGPGIGGITDPLLDAYRIKIDKGTAFLNRPRPACLDVLVLPTLIWPALTSSKEVVRNQLEKLFFPDAFSCFNGIRDELVRSGNLFFSSSLLRFDPKLVDRKQLLAELRGKTEKYLKRQSQATIKFQAASQILHTWVSPRGPIGNMLGKVLEQKSPGAAGLLEELRSFAGNWSSQAYVESKIPKKIDGKAMHSLADCGREAGRLASEWIRITEMPEHDDQQVSQVLEYRRKLLGHMELCRKTLPPEKCENPIDRMAVTYAYHVFEEIKKVFGTDREQFEYANEQLVNVQLNSELLLIPELELDEHGVPLFIDEDKPIPGKELESFKNVIVRYLARQPQECMLLEDDSAKAFRKYLVDTPLDLRSGPTWKAAMDAHIRAKNFGAPSTILSFLRFPGWLPDPATFSGKDEPPFDFDEYCAGTESRLAEERNRLQNRKREIDARITFSRQKGFLEEDDRQRLTRIIDRITPDTTCRIDLANRSFDEVERGLDQCRQRSIGITRGELEEWPERHNYQKEFRQICEIAQSGDILRAFDLFNVLKNEKELPSLQPAPLPGLDFYPDFCAKSAALFNSRLEKFKEFGQQFDRWRGGGKIGDYDIGTTLQPKASREAADILHIWDIQRRQQGVFSPEPLQKIFEYIGFHPASFRKLADNHFVMKLPQPLGNRNDCILQDFGSDCRDGYDILCLSSQKTSEVVIDEAKRLSGGHRPVIVMYFRQMSHQRRTELARLLRQPGAGNLRLLVLDDILMVYLCLCRNKLLSFFNAAAQFSPAEPFTNMPGIVPVEMFFGREKEVDQIANMRKSSLVYGGRQLGKTVLLRYVEQRDHAPEQGRIVLFINLKDSRDEIERETRAIWSVIAQSLAPFDIVGARAVTEKTVRQSINDWLDEEGKQDRTILLLLDEADLFLRLDAEDNWRQLDAFNAMMIEKERRFKVVFAGLHNVHQTAVSSNSPIAHLQEPVCIGPFLRREEIADAMRMIKYPFEAMGYRFKDEGLIGSILAQVNYYPSLIQIFCMKLLESLKQRDDLTSATPRCGVDTPPPFLVTEKEVERVFGNREFQKEISVRFQYTLNLDNRYFVIALALALEYLETKVDRYSQRDILEIARGWWPEGFNEKEHQLLVVKSLLDEMSDLGVLRKVDDDAYFFRNANIIRLLGTKKSIENDLLNALTNTDLFKTPDPLTYRRRLRTESWRRMPLIRPQEDEIFNRTRNDVFLLFGTKASGLSDVHPFYGENVVPNLHPFHGTTTGEFMAWLDRAMELRSKNISILPIPPHLPWTGEWIRASKKKLAALTSPDKVVKMLFLCDAAKTWDYFSEPNEQTPPFQNFTLRPWEELSVQHWLSDFDFAKGAVDPRRLFEKYTGFWHHFLMEAGESCHQDQGFWEGRLNVYATPEKRRKMLSMFDLPETPANLLRSFAEFSGDDGELSSEEFRIYLEASGKGDRVELVPRFTTWGRRLGFLTLPDNALEIPGDQTPLKLNPFLAELIQEGGPA